MDRFNVETLGPATIDSPITIMPSSKFVSQQSRLLHKPFLAEVERCQKESKQPESFEIAGPSKKIYFSPPTTKAMIVTCGGLCPGINSVIRGLVMQLWYQYQVKNIVGVPYGYGGLAAKSKESFIPLNPDLVMNIHEQGGSFLGSSRGTPPTSEIVDSLQKSNANLLFVIGGDGTMKGALAISKEIKKRGLKISIVGIPKTIDNDIPFVRRSFGFETAVSIACQAAHSGHNEAKGTPNGIGLVKLMGRHSGYIAANTALATGHANFCLIPEVDFSLEGSEGLLAQLEERIKDSDHTLIIVAEGAGQKYFADGPGATDASGNKKLGDIGQYMKRRIVDHFKEKNITTSVKYIDPSYLIRSAAANPADNLFCANFAQNAVHGAMSGKTAFMVGYWHGKMTYVPLEAINGKNQQIDQSGHLWFNVLQMTGQPQTIGDEASKD